MGISKVTGIAATAFLVTSVSLFQLGMKIIMLPFLATSIVAFVITVASHDAINLPWIVGKNSVGRFPFWLVWFHQSKFQSMLLSVIPPLQPMRVTRCLDPGSGQDPSNPKITNITDQEYYSNNIFMKHAYTDLKQVPRDKGKAHHHVLEFKNSKGESER